MTFPVPSYVGTKVMPISENILTVNKMAIASNKQQITTVEPIELIEFEKTVETQEKVSFDEEAMKYRKHLAYVEALRQLEQRKTRALTIMRRM
ncbi:MAG: hypothetical protein ACXADL_16910 [Candidatus Thorarchaeota archaeon]|jgi:hypothetical protein